MKKVKQILSVLLIAVMLVGVMPIMSFAVSNITEVDGETKDSGYHLYQQENGGNESQPKILVTNTHFSVNHDVFLLNF